MAHVWVRGDFDLSSDIGRFEYSIFGPGSGERLDDPTLPAAGRGYWYLVRDDCPSASWTAEGPHEHAGRDAALP